MPKISSKTHIIISGAKVHNLKNVDIAIPRNKMTVITGLSGSGKSSLAFHTLYAEGQRRYIESLSSYARLFLGKLNKPDVDNISGIAPAIAIEQKVKTNNPRSTVGTSTEIYDYLKLLFARIGKTISPLTSKEIKKDKPEDILKIIKNNDESIKGLILFKPQLPSTRTLDKHLQMLVEQGYTRAFINEKISFIQDIINTKLKNEKIWIIADRITCKNSDENISRVLESISLAFYEGQGTCAIYLYKNDNKWHIFSNKFEENGISYEEPSIDFFSFNSPVGACPTCEGFGKVMGIDENLVIPNKDISVYENAIVCWRGDKMQRWKNELIRTAEESNFPIHKPIKDLNEDEYKLLFTGNKFFSGIDAFFKYVESKSYKIQYRVMLSRYKGKTTCYDCKGSRLRKDASFVKINDTSITEITRLSISDAIKFFKDAKFENNDKIIAYRLIQEISTRLSTLADVGLDYLTLDRQSKTLSGGESQRINLATSLGSSLIGSMYILDEPSIGLHPRDTSRLIKVLQRLRDIGNSVIIVEHEEEIMRVADEIIDIGPFAGKNGGEIVFQGNHNKLLSCKSSLTADYLNKNKFISIPSYRRKWKNKIFIEGACKNNLKNIDVNIPLNILTVVTGVSGSGKSSLINTVLFTAINNHVNSINKNLDYIKSISGDLSLINDIKLITQNPIGRSSRSNPITYVKAFDEIRTLFANEHGAMIAGYKPKHFSFNVEGGRCDECEGEGIINISMQFMADVKLVCENCQGQRYKDDVLEVKYKNKNISEVLKMTIDEALIFFNDLTNKYESKIIQKIAPLQDVGLGYIQLGQASSTLSGGEAQRIKLASFLGINSKRSSNTLFIFDEPTTGLHFYDIEKLLKAINSLIESGNHVIIIEHNPEIIKSADWIIDLGPEGGYKGGNIVFEGLVEDIIEHETSYTGKYLKKHVKGIYKNT